MPASCVWLCCWLRRAAADELGILMYHDLMSAQGGHAPANTTTQIAEVQHQIRRLSAHPSIAIWDGCNGEPRRCSTVAGCCDDNMTTSAGTAVVPFRPLQSATATASTHSS